MRAYDGGIVIDAHDAIARIDLDAAKIVWLTECPDHGLVKTVVGDSVICQTADATSVIRDGKVAWKHAGTFVVANADLFAVGTVLVDATGHDVGSLPSGQVVAICSADDILVVDGGKLRRVVKKKPAWSVPSGEALKIDGCGATIVTLEHDGSVVARARDSGKELARVRDASDFWITGDEVAIATSTGLQRASRDLATLHRLDLPPIASAMSLRGDRELVRGRGPTYLLDRGALHAELALPWGAQAILGATRVLTSDGHLFDLPARQKHWSRPVTDGVALATELRDLPTPFAVTADDAPTQALDGEIAGYAVTGNELDVATVHGVAAFDLATKRWVWSAPLANVRALTASAAIVVAATADSIIGIVGGHETWRVHATAATVDADGTLVLADDRVYDATSGAPLGTLGHGPHVLLGDLAIAAEANRIVAHVPGVHMVPAWTLEVRGRVVALERSGDGVLVALADGDAYRLDGAGRVTAIAGLGLGWHASGDAITGETRGGPIPPAVITPPPGKPEPYHVTDLEQAPAIATPWPAPPAMEPSWQLTIYDQGGGVRTRNDYALTGHPLAALRVGAAPFVYTRGSTALVLDPVHGDPLRRVILPVVPGADSPTFSTIVDGKPVVGTILAAPLRVVVF